jgi:hypothetical protein
MMSRIVIVILIYHYHKPVDLIIIYSLFILRCTKIQKSRKT